MGSEMGPEMAMAFWGIGVLFVPGDFGASESIFIWYYLHIHIYSHIVYIYDS